MTSKYLIIGLTIATVAVTAVASLERPTSKIDPIKQELDNLSMSPGERMLTSAMEYHPVVLVANWISDPRSTD